jgi:hypothetical protein
MAINFKQDTFEGTLGDLFDECFHISNDQLNNAHEWVKSQISIPGNILPIRKYREFSKRGEVKTIDGLTFLSVDNEPLAALYKYWLTGSILDVSLGQLLTQNKIPASWKNDIPNAQFKFAGVQSSFRKNGLKLAHIVDAAGILPSSPENDELVMRYLRSLSPVNIFLFPSYRRCAVSLDSSDKNNEFSSTKDPAESPLVQKLAFNYMMGRLGWTNTEREAWLNQLGSPDIFLNDYASILQNTKVIATPRHRTKTSRSNRANQHLSIVRDYDDPSRNALPRIGLGNALTIDEALPILAKYLDQIDTNVVQIDGRTHSENNPAKWIHIRVDGYEKFEPFQSCHGPVFGGHEYNGIVNFHGDTKIGQLRRFVELCQTAEDYHDVLIPSATYEGRTLPHNRHPKPKFALRGFEGEVDGFYLYHDQWRTQKAG